MYNYYFESVDDLARYIVCYTNKKYPGINNKGDIKLQYCLYFIYCYYIKLFSDGYNNLYQQYPPYLFDAEFLWDETGLLISLVNDKFNLGLYNYSFEYLIMERQFLDFINHFIKIIYEKSDIELLDRFHKDNSWYNSQSRNSKILDIMDIESDFNKKLYKSHLSSFAICHDDLYSFLLKSQYGPNMTF